MRHAHAGTFAAAMRQQADWRAEDELAALVAEQAREMRADGQSAVWVEVDPDDDDTLSDGVTPRWVTDSRPNILPPRHPQQEAEGLYVDPGTDVEWTERARDLRAQEAWKPSLVRKGQRQRVEHHVRLESIDQAIADLDAARATLAAGGIPTRGSRGVTLKRRIARLERIVEAATAPPVERPEWKPFTRAPLVVPPKPLRQADYAEAEWLRPRV